jgi:hypothetical protein
MFNEINGTMGTVYARENMSNPWTFLYGKKKCDILHYKSDDKGNKEVMLIHKGPGWVDEIMLETYTPEQYKLIMKTLNSLPE